MAESMVEDKPLSILQKRWRKFRTLKRGWYSFLFLTGALLLSFLNPLMINNRALIVRYDGVYHFPVLSGHIEAKELGQHVIGEARYRELKSQYREEGAGNWVLMPPYPYHPNENLLLEEDLPGPPPHSPTSNHWMGTDDRGRDVFARLIYGFRISMLFGLGVLIGAYSVGIIAGAILGYFGGWVDILGQRFVEIWSGLPFLYTVIIISSLIRPEPWVLVLILCSFTWMRISFYVRGEFYREKAKDYVAAAVSQGESNPSIMFRHILPNGLTPIISFAPFGLVGYISSLVSLDFLGFGVQPPTASWGELVKQGLANINEWHLVLFPLGAMFCTLMMVVFIGEAVREAFDPKTFSRLR
ncbi:MAG TPA: ABC transporter permease subunit [Deltaproteobacteria bacterium]|nr:ABC transporter permease subunit [Deltaproteobacteria bacterium]